MQVKARRQVGKFGQPVVVADYGDYGSLGEHEQAGQCATDPSREPPASRTQVARGHRGVRPIAGELGNNSSAAYIVADNPTVVAARRDEGMIPVLLASDQLAPTAARWPLHAALELGALLTAPGCGRAWTQALMWEWRLAHLADTAQVVVSELVTNAVQASRGLHRAVIQLSLASDRERLLIFVRDFDPGAPAPRHASDDDESGRGLMLVEAISDRFGWYGATDGTPGKVVWAIL